MDIKKIVSGIPPERIKADKELKECFFALKPIFEQQ